MTLDLTGLRQVGGTDTESAPTPASGLDFTGLKEVGSVDLSGLKAVGPALGIDQSAARPIAAADNSGGGFFHEAGAAFKRSILSQNPQSLADSLEMGSVLTRQDAPPTLADGVLKLAGRITDPIGAVADDLGALTGIHASDVMKGASDTVRGWAKAGDDGSKPSVPTLGDIHNMSDAVSYVGSAIGNAAGSSAPSLVAGTAVAAATKNPVAGFFAGAFGPSYIQNSGDTYATLRDNPGVQQAIKEGKITDKQVAGWAAAASVPIAALDAYGAEKMLPIQKLKGEIVSRVLKRILIGGATEGGTEGFQQVLQEATLAAAGGDHTLADAAMNVIESTVQGTIGGTAVSAVTEPLSKEQPSAQAGAGVAGGVDASAVTEGAGVSPPPSAPSRDSERLDSPRLTAADRASPLPNDLIDEGKKVFESALGKKAIDVPTSDIATPSMRAEADRRAADIAGTAAPASQAAPSAIEHTIEGTLTPAEAASAPVAAPTRLLSDAEFMGGASTVDEAAHAAATSPLNNLAEPTDAQKAAGNYKTGKIKVAGLDISIENPKGSVRSGTSPDGSKWETTLPAHYGYITGVTARSPDKEHVDVYVGDAPESDRAFIVNQVDPKTGKFDEAKIVLGAQDSASAITIYDHGFSDGSGPQRSQSAIEMPVADLKEYLNTHGFKLPARPSPAAGRVAVALPTARSAGAAPAVQAPAIQGVAQSAGQVPEPQKSVLPQLRGPGDHAASADAKLPVVSPDRGGKADAAAPVGPDGQRRELRAGKPSVGNQEGTGAKPAEKPSDNGQGRDKVDGRVGGDSGSRAVDNPLSPVKGDVGGRRSADSAAVSRPTEPETQTKLKEKIAAKRAEKAQPVEKTPPVEPQKLTSEPAAPPVISHANYRERVRQQIAAATAQAAPPAPTLPVTPKVTPKVEEKPAAAPEPAARAAAAKLKRDEEPAIQPTDAFREQAQAIGTRLRAELDRLGLKDIGLRIQEQLGMMVEGKMHAADGQYFQKLITIALDAENPDATLAHEAIHALRELSLFGKDEWAILERQSRKKWMDEHKIAEAYGAFPEWVQVEEGIAHAYGEWSRQGSGFDGIIVKAFRKIKAVLRAIARAFGKDFTSIEDVFAKIDSGEVGSRPGNVEFLSGGPTMYQAAWHGSPHDFDEFKSDKIGTGEGAQAFGWGLYFAGKKEIAEYYRNKLAPLKDGEIERAKTALRERGIDPDEDYGYTNERDYVTLAASLIEGYKPEVAGRLFKVDIPEDSELMVWEKPLNEQPQGVQDAIDAAIRTSLLPESAIEWFERNWDALTGKTFYSKFADELARDALLETGLPRNEIDTFASEALKTAGVPGHKFLDATSRDKGDGTYNYVIYDDSRVKVQAKFALRRTATAPAQRRTTPPVSILPNISTVASSVSTRIMNAIKGGPGKNDGESIGDYSMRKMVDYLHPLREMIDSVGPVADRVNAYLEARLALDSAVASIQDMHGKYVTPAVEALSMAGASLDELHQYLYALHAEERNRVVGLRNDPTSDFYKAVTDLNTVGASGWSTNHARQVLRQLRVDPTKFAGIQQAGRLVRQMLDENLLAQKNAGLISDASYNSLSQQWQNYVPLQAEDGIDENGDFTMPGRGRGFDVRGKEFKGATGRFTEAENIPAWAISATERSKLRQAKNRVGKSILRFINQYDPMGTNLAEVYWSDAPAGGFGNIQKAPPVYKRELDASGKVVNKAVPYSTIAPDMYATKVAGKTFYIKFADEKVGQALKNMNAVQMHFLLRASRLVTNLQSLVNTRLNPEFVAKNFFRDLATGIIHLEGFSGRETAKAMGDIPSAFAAVWRNARGRPGAGPMDQALAELTKAGGRIIFEQQRTVQDSIKALHKQMAAASAGNGSPKALWEGFKKLVGDVNDTVEMGIRLSAYAGMRAKGQTVKQAALATRDLTVDFRKHGEMGPTGNALYAFFNASVQGNFNVGKRLIKSRRAQIAAGTIMLSGFMMDVLNRSLSGDDDDGENLYEKMLKNEPWKFERQMVLFYGPGKGSYFTIPLPFGYNAVYYTGLQGSAALHGTVAPMEAISSSIRVMVDAFNPMGGGGGWINMFSPTVLDPLIEIDRNKNFADIPIYPTTYPGDTTPDSQQSFGKTPDVFKWAAEQINALTGGNKIEPGAVDIHPDTIEHMWDFVSGGIGRFFSSAADPLVKTAGGRSDEIAVEKLPFVRSFYGEQGDDNKRSEYYKKREAVQTAKSRLSDYKAAGDAAETQDFIERNKIDVESIPAFDAAEKRLRKIRKQRRRIEAEGGDTSALDEGERKAMDAARLAYAKNASRDR